MRPWRTRLLIRLLPAALCVLAGTGARSILAEDPYYDEMDYQEPPYAEDDYAFTDSTMSLAADVLANDYGFSAPLDPTTVTILDPPQTGSATVDPDTGVIEFTPDPGAPAIDYLVYRVSDEMGQDSNPAFLWIDVMHDPPVAYDDFEFTSYTHDVTVSVLGNDFGGTAPIDPGTVTILTQPAHGSVSVDGATGEVTYEPDGQFAGADWFEYVVSDTYGVESNVGRVHVDVYNYSPHITWFDAWPQSYGYWIFEGEVQDERPETCTVEFSGIISGTTTPDETGYFRKAIYLGPDASGPASAIATDELGLESNTADTYLFGGY